jgi:hypothetical protein
MIPKEFAVKAFTLAACVPEVGMRYALDCFGGHYSCLWRSEGAMVEGTVHPVIGEDNSLMVCIRARAEMKFFAVSASFPMQWFKVSELDSDKSVVEEVKGFEFSIG